MIRKTLLTLTLPALLLTSTTAQAEKRYLFQWDEGQGTTMPGWTWHEDGNQVITSNHPGWIVNGDGPFGGAVTFPWGPSPRTFEMGGSSSGAWAKIDPSRRAPSTNCGGSLHIYQDDLDGNRAAWWLWYDGMPLSERGVVTNEAIDRWSFYIYLEGISGASSEGAGSTFHMGTYLCKDTGEPAYGTGDGCPYEGPGNKHYYHYLQFSPGAWLHVELDEHPQHLRGSFVTENNPALAEFGMDYLSSLNQWYFTPVTDEQPGLVSYWLDEMYFYATSDPEECAEPQQNNDSITSLWVGYWPETGKWQIFWQDQSYETASSQGLNDYTNSTFEVRWSTTPITNANYEQATPIQPEWFSGPQYTGSSEPLIRRVSSWRPAVTTQFELPAQVTSSAAIIYFAIKDVSIAGGHSGTNWPYNRPDGHDAASPYIRTINYHLPPAGPSHPVITTIYSR